MSKQSYADGAIQYIIDCQRETKRALRVLRKIRADFVEEIQQETCGVDGKPVNLNDNTQEARDAVNRIDDFLSNFEMR